MMVNKDLIVNAIIMSTNSHLSPILFHYKIQELGAEAGSGTAQVANDNVCTGEVEESQVYKANVSFTQLLTVILFI
jgi:hypothetical protein